MIIKAKKKPKHIQVIGMKDPRGPDNTITVWIDDNGDLRIKVRTPHIRCYTYSHTEINNESVTIIQKR